MGRPHCTTVLEGVLFQKYFSFGWVYPINAVYRIGGVYRAEVCDIIAGLNLLNMKRALIVLLTLCLFAPTVFAYTDVDSAHPYAEAINYITAEGIVRGYDDGTYKPDAKINRAEFTKILVESKFESDPSGFADDCFSDVPNDAWFSSYVCYARVDGIIDGYPDGTFGPANEINLAEASKILVNVFELEKVQPTGTAWYSQYIETLGALKIIPPSFEYLDDKVTRGEMAEMVWRIMTERSDLESLDVTSLEAAPCQSMGEDLPANIDMDKVRQTWLDWYNEERTALGLHEYALDDQLNRTATAWSNISRDRGYIDHKRPGQTSYYDFYGILDWFKDLGVEFENSMFSENIAWEMYYCDASQDDCTQEMIDAIRKGFNFFMSEKGGSYTAHYDSIISPNYNIIGLGIAVDDAANKYYLTVHYAKAISNDPMQICE